MQKSSQRMSLSAADLFVLLDREFRRRQPRDCRSCYVPLPFRVDVLDGRANWEVITPQCPLQCESVLQDVVQEFQARYELSSMRA